jgi:hypothetical protein
MVSRLEVTAKRATSCRNEKGGRDERQDERQNGSVRYCDLNLSAFFPLSHACICSRSEWRCLGYSTESGGGTASGQKLNPLSLTAAHRTLPFGTKVTVTNKSNGRSVVVTINDRSPFLRSRIIDVSPAAARVLGFSGLTQVTVTPGGTGNAAE